MGGEAAAADLIAEDAPADAASPSLILEHQVLEMLRPLRALPITLGQAGFPGPPSDDESGTPDLGHVHAPALCRASRVAAAAMASQFAWFTSRTRWLETHHGNTPDTPKKRVVDRLDRAAAIACGPSDTAIHGEQGFLASEHPLGADPMAVAGCGVPRLPGRSTGVGQRQDLGQEERQPSVTRRFRC